MDASANQFDDLRDYIHTIEHEGHLQRISGAHWDREIGALTETVALSDRPRALVFDDIPDYPDGGRVATNLYTTERLQALALGLPADASGVDLVEHWRERSTTLDRPKPTVVQDGPVTENVQTGDDVDLTAFPTPRWHAHDGGRFFGTGDTVYTRGPDGDWVNAAPYRCQLHDETTLGILIVQTHHGWAHLNEYWDRGEDAPIAMTAGQPPAVYAAACLPLPAGESELDLAGGLQGSPLEVVETDAGIPVPAHAEIAVVGRVPPPEDRTLPEGPFGECAGYYAGGREERPVIEVEAVWHRDDPILQGNPTMYGSAKKHALGAEIATSARVWDAIEDDVPNIEGVAAVYQPCQAGADVLAVAIEQAYAGHPKQAAMMAAACQPNNTTNKAVIVVDEDVDPSDTEEVMFAFATRCDPAEDVDFVRNKPSWILDARIDPERREANDLSTSTMLVDACKPWARRDEYARRVRVPDDLAAEVRERFSVDDWTPAAD